MTNYLPVIKKHEGLRLKPYHCSEGKLTIGIGRNLESNGISEEEAEYMALNDIAMAEKAASSLVRDFLVLNDNRKIVLVSMAFQMGRTGLSKFVKMLDAVDLGAFRTASDEMLDSRWAKQTPERAKELSEMMKG